MMTNEQFDAADRAIRNTRVGLTHSHDRLKSLRTTVLPRMEQNLTQMEQGFNSTLKKFDFPIPKPTVAGVAIYDLPIGLIAGGAGFLLIATTVGLMLYVDSKKDDEPRRTRRKRKRRSSKPRGGATQAQPSSTSS